MGRARTFLLAIRRRFGNQRAEAGRATFLLGRLGLDLGHDANEAVRWLELYRREYAQGALAEEALGRLISAHQDAGNAKKARLAATKYLEQYPNGSFKELARSTHAR